LGRFRQVALVGLLSGFALSLVSHAQDAQTSFHSSTDVVLVPVVVHAKQGRLGELKAEQFSVREDGKPQKIASVELIRAGTKVTRKTTPGEYSNQFEATGPSRIVILAIDMINTPFLDQAFARQQLLKYIGNSLQAGDRVAVFAMYKDGSVRLIHDISGDPALLAEALKGAAASLPNSAASTKSVPPNTRQSMELGVLASNTSATKPVNASDPSVQQAVDEAESMAAFQDETNGAGAFDLRRNMEATLESIWQIAQAYSGTAGRKSLIWITSAFPFDITGTGDLLSPQAYFYGFSQEPMKYYATHSGALPPMPEVESVISNSDLSPLRQKFRGLLQQLAEYNIAIYPVDARGVMALDVDAADTYSNKLLAALDRERAQNSQSTMAAVARMTGGKSCYNRNDIANCVKVAAEDSEQYYLLSYYRDKKNNKPGWRTLTVKLDVPDTEIRARTGYYYGNTALNKEARLQELGAAARSNVAFSAIQFSARFMGVSGGGDNRQVKYQIYVSPESIRALNEAEGNFNLEFVVVASAKGSKMYSVATTVGKNLPANAYSIIQNEGLAYSNVITVPAGDYTVHFIVRDAAKNVVGSVIAPVRTEDPALQAASVAGKSSAPVVARRTATVPGLSTSEEASTAWLPPDVDVLKPPVDAGVECPADILQVTSNPSKELVDSVAQFSATEHVVHEDLSAQGIPKSREAREFDYVASISQDAHGLTVEEFREPRALDNLGGIRTTGLAALAIAFHPFFHDDFDMRCEGLGKWNGQAAWLVYFQQLKNKPGQLRSYVVAGNHYPVRLKGRAWIGADNLQIVHLETDLLQPIPEIGLMNEHTDVSYGPVHFKTSGADLWLPKTAELYVRFGKRSFHRSESFDNFKLFATDTAYNVKLPKSAEAEKTESGQEPTPQP